jgi:hypothetical protein
MSCFSEAPQQQFIRTRSLREERYRLVCVLGLARQSGGQVKLIVNEHVEGYLEAISRPALAMALSRSGLEDKFRAPRSISDQALLTTARAFAAECNAPRDASPLPRPQPRLPYLHHKKESPGQYRLRQRAGINRD